MENTEERCANIGSEGATPGTSSDRIASVRWALVAPSVIIVLSLIRYQVSYPTAIDIAVISIELALALCSIVSIGVAIKKYIAIRLSADGYIPLNRIPDKRMRLFTYVMLPTLFFGYIVFVGVQTFITARCINKDTGYVFRFMLDLSEIAFAVLQTVYLFVSMSKWSIGVDTKLQNVIMSTDIVFIVRFCVQTYDDFIAYNLSQFPNLKLCAEPKESDLCKVYNSLDNLSMFVNTYLYSFPVQYLLFCVVIMSQFHQMDGVDRGGPNQNPETIVEADTVNYDPRFLQRLIRNTKKWFILTMKLISSYLFHITLIVCFLKLGANIYVHSETFQKPFDDCNTTEHIYIDDGSDFKPEHAGQFVVIGTIFYYTVYIVSFLAAVLALNRESCRRIRVSAKVGLLLLLALTFVAFTVLYALEVVRAQVMQYDGHVVSITSEVFVFLNFLGIPCQTFFITAFLTQQRSTSIQPFRYAFSRGCIVFIGICNIEKWVEDFVFPPEMIVFFTKANNTMFDIPHWWLFVKLFFPFMGFYRVLSSCLCYSAFVIHNTL